MVADKTPYTGDINSIPENAVAITPNDTPGSSLAFITRALWVGVSGDVCVNMKGSGAAVVLKNVSGLLPGRFTDVLATNTTATNIIALW